MNDRATVDILIQWRESGKPMSEEVPAFRLDYNRFRLAGSPGFAPGLASGDEIELDPSVNPGYRLIRRGGNVSVQVFHFGEAQSCQGHMTEWFKEIGGWLDGGMDGEYGHLLIFTIPVSAGFKQSSWS